MVPGCGMVWFRGWWLGVLLLAGLLGGPGVAAASAPMAKIVNGVRQVLVPERPAADGVLTVADGNFYLQCLNRPRNSFWQCESAGLEGESWLHYALTPARQERLNTLGFRVDPSSGNFVSRIPRKTEPETLAALLEQVLAEGYGVPPDEIQVYADWLASVPCHTRIGADADNGGSILTPSWGYMKDAVDGCSLTKVPMPADLPAPSPPTPPSKAPPASLAALDKRYAEAIAKQLDRLRNGAEKQDIWAIFTADIAYIQCQYDHDGRQMYCEAASVDAIGPELAPFLTPARQHLLVRAGYHEPGRVMNYWRYYRSDQYTPAKIANSMLAVFFQAYGYRGTPALTLVTEASPTPQPL